MIAEFTDFVVKGRDIIMRKFLAYITVFQIVTHIYDVLIGSALVFGALKWRKGLLSTVACYWGIVLGFLVGFFLVYSRHIDIIAILITTIMGAIIFPVLTYSVPAINRFVLGFLITGKLSYMITTYMWKEGYIELRVATA